MNYLSDTERNNLGGNLPLDRDEEQNKITEYAERKLNGERKDILEAANSMQEYGIFGSPAKVINFFENPHLHVQDYVEALIYELDEEAKQEFKPLTELIFS